MIKLYRGKIKHLPALQRAWKGKHSEWARKLRIGLWATTCGSPDYSRIKEVIPEYWQYRSGEYLHDIQIVLENGFIGYCRPGCVELAEKQNLGGSEPG